MRRNQRKMEYFKSLPNLCSSGLLLVIGILQLTQITGAQDVTVVGDELRGSRQSIEVINTTIILNDEVNVNGLVYAYSAWIKEKTKVKFQIWRGINGTELDFRLMSQYEAYPTVVDQREDFYIVSDLVSKCFMITAGDRIGITFDETPSPIPYVFDNRVLAPLIYKTFPETPIVGKVKTFNSLAFPYDFSVRAYIFTDVENMTAPDADGFVDCPPFLLIPDYFSPTPGTTTTMQPITGAPGATGATGPMGATGPIGPIGPQGNPGFNGTQGEVGIEGPMGPPGENGSIGATGPQGEKGDVGDIGFTGPIGGVGETGATGPMGPVGPVGPQGVIPDNFTFPTPAAQVDEEIFEDPDMVFYLYIWLGIVSALLLLLFIIVICLCCNVCKLRKELQRYNKYKKNDDYYQNMYDNPAVIGTNRKHKPNGNAYNDSSAAIPDYNQTLSGKPEWMNSLKPDSTLDYEIGTLDRERSGRRQNRLSSAPTSQNEVDPNMVNSAPNLSRGLSTDYYTTPQIDKDEVVNY